MSEEHRTKIANSQILKRLIEAAEGKLEITQVQATVGLGLLRKVLPDLSATEHSGALTLSHEEALDELDDGPREDDQAKAEG